MSAMWFVNPPIDMLTGICAMQLAPQIIATGNTEDTEGTT